MKIKLKYVFMISFISLILFCIVLIGIFANTLLNHKFKEYITKEQNRKNAQILNQIQNQYKSDTKFDMKTVENIGVESLSEGIVLKLKDINGTIIWDATNHNNGLCIQMIDHMAKNTLSKFPDLNGGYVETDKDVIYNGEKIGVLSLGYYGPFYFNDNDLAFINQLNKLFIKAGAVFIMIAIIFASIISNKVSAPILKVINKTKQISLGNYKEKDELRSNTIEINELIVNVEELAKKLETQEKLRKKITSDMSHELRTPLTSIQGNLEAMIDGVWEPTTERLASCNEEILRISRMIQNIEKLNELEQENNSLNIENIDISLVMKNILNNFEKEILDKKINLEYNFEEIFLNVDKDKISQLFVNIVSNAIKYTNENGNIKIDIFEKNKKVIIVIEDTGIGISKEDIPYVFERLYRADKSRNISTGGRGIGLSIAKKIVDLHNGTISIESELNVGTKVTIEF